MSALGSSSETDQEQRIVNLVQSLRAIEQELQSLTGGQVDAVSGPGGHPIFLQEAQEKLLQSENRYRSLTKATAQIVWTTDAKGLVSGELPEWQAFTGQSTEEILGYGCQQAIHPDDQKRTFETWTRAVSSGKSYNLEYRLRRRDGVYRDFAVRGVPVQAGHGSISEWVGCCMDITQQKQSQQSIMENEVRLDLALQAAHLGIWDVDLATDHAIHSLRHDQIFGFETPPAEWGMEIFRRHVLPEDRDKAQRTLEEALVTGLFLLECRIVRQDQSIRWIKAEGKVSRDEEGVPLRILGVVGDITEQKVAQQELARNQSLLRMASRISRLGAWQCDVPALNVMWSDETAAIHDVDAGYSPPVATAIEYYVPAYREIIAEAFRLCVEQGDPFDVEAQIVSAKGRRVWVRAMGEAVRDENGRVIQVQGALQDIESLKQAEEALSQKDTLIRMAGQLTRTGGWFVDTSNQQAFWSDEVCDILQFPRGNAPALHDALALHPPQSRVIITAAMTACMTTGTPFDVEIEINNAKGERIWARVCGEPERAADNTISRVWGAFQDITQRKQADEKIKNQVLELQHSREAVSAGAELNRGVLDSMLAHIAVVDSEGTIIAVNNAWRQFAQENTAEHQELLARTEIGTNYLAVCRASRGKFSEEAMAAHDGLVAVLKGEKTNFTLEYPCHGLGLERWYLLSATPLKTRNGGAVVSHLDISARKRAESQIREQAAFLDKAQDAIVVRDLKGEILFWNKGAERMYGWMREDVLGLNMDAAFYPDLKTIKEINRHVISKGEWNGELQHFTKDRTEIVVEARMTLIRDQQGNPKSILAIKTDITEKKKIEAQFMRAQRMESIGTLAGGIAHDLNNILAPILMSIDLLKSESDSPQTTKILQTIQTSAKRGADIVRQVLSFARGVEGQRIEVQPKHLLNDLENIIRDTFPKDIRLHFSVPNDIWTILGDPTQVHQVLLNLSVNARDAMPNGGNLTISVENCVLDEQYAAMHNQAKPGRYLKIKVADSGMGIPPKLIDKIFEPFFTTKELSKGTGLGLSTVMAIVKSHNGLVNVYSDQGKGTNFTIYLPAMEMSADALKEQSILASMPRGNGETILVVDDEASILTITGQTLETYGYHVLTATDGADALAIYLQHRDEIAVVLTDMMMPVMDGPAMIHALMRVNPAVKIIAASGLNAQGEAEKATAGGLKHFLIKPYTAEVMLQTIRAILDGRNPSTKSGVLAKIK